MMQGRHSRRSPRDGSASEDRTAVLVRDDLERADDATLAVDENAADASAKGAA
jgi:hypothetical protein